MAYSILGWGEPLVEVRTEHLPKAMVLDAPDYPGNLDSAAHSLVGDGLAGFSGDILNAINAAKHVLTGDNPRNLTGLLTAVGDDNCDCSRQFIEWLERHGIDSNDVRRISHSHMGAYFEGYRDELGSFPYARSGAAFESLTELQVADAIRRHESNHVGLIITGITHARTKGRNRVADVLERAKLQGVTTLYAVNFRMSLWGTRDDESRTNARVGFRAVAPYIDFCSLGREEAEILLDRAIAETSRSKRETAESVLDLGVRHGAALTGYPEAHMAFRSGKKVHNIERFAPKNELTGVNTTGAGDNLTGAFAALYLISKNVSASFEGACRIAEMSTTVEGGIYHPPASEIEHSLSKVR
ncbi:MAG: PfkB family carbohydrate kinase [Candidatus Poribacteria bacterium]|nr:PfkB family carbohydrate kinase [Candidatus Poribacteria bacterium]MDE0504272.1 PfkB family carbohydrate kinase [Candidatus Poribacteria bacterium]